VILHIGLHRTGTTFIQKTVLPSILRDGFITPKKDRYAVGPYLMGLKPDIKIDPDKRARIKIISREGLSGGPCFTNRFDHLDVVKEFCGTPLVVVSYRNPVDLAKSLYLHCYTHNLHNRPLSRFGESNVGDDGTATYAGYYTKLEETGKLDLRTLLEKWRTVGDVRAISLDLQKDNPLYYFNCFRSFLGEHQIDALPADHHYLNATVDVARELSHLNTRREAAGKTPYTVDQFNEDVEAVGAKIRASEAYKFFKVYAFFQPH